MPPVMLDLPAPEPPSGLYARLLDPMALDDLGFQRDAVACAMLLPPDNDASVSTEALVTARREASRAAIEASGMCACEAAAALDARVLLPQCVDKATRPGCNVDDQLAAVEAALEPVYAALGTTQPPIVHWRLVGKTDRPRWFARQQAMLAERHDGGSTIYLEGQAVPSRGNGPLLKALLESEDVVAVARQNSGQAILVVREIGKTLVLDHFQYAAVGKSYAPLLPYFDNASVGRYRAMLAKPSETRKLRFEPGKGNVVEVDVTHLAAVDAAIRGGASLSGVRPESARELPERRVELIAAQAPFGQQGQRLDVRVELTSTGAQWASLLTSDDLMPGLDGLSLEPVELSDPDTTLPYVLAGTAFERSVVYGLEQVPAFMTEIDTRFPGAIKGTANAWEFVMPPSDLEGLIAPGTAFKGLRSAFAERQYTVELTTADEGQVLLSTIQPQ